eukprot:NODE_32_length_37098_cov_1.132760.p29 type:complete len:110 gc:universal NODE_32_length_37098_cov_1.132760:32326-31997(-)
MSLMYSGKSLEMLIKATYMSDSKVDNYLLDQTYISFGMLLIMSSIIKLINRIAGDTNRNTILFSRAIMGTLTLFFMWLPLETVGGVIGTVTILMGIQVAIDVFALFCSL